MAPESEQLTCARALSVSQKSQQQRRCAALVVYFCEEKWVIIERKQIIYSHI